MSSRRKLTIAVSGLNNTDNPGPGVPVIRALRDSKKFDVRIIALVYETLEPGIYMDGIADRVYMMPPVFRVGHPFLANCQHGF